jgi:hypothetical protein
MLQKRGKTKLELRAEAARDGRSMVERVSAEFAERAAKNQRIKDEAPLWYEVLDLIGALDYRDANVKHLLIWVYRHTNKSPGHKKFGKAWMPQKELAREMGVSLRTVEYAFALAKKEGFVTVDRKRKNKGREQYNEYWLNLPEIKNRSLVEQILGEEATEPAAALSTEVISTGTILSFED